MEQVWVAVDGSEPSQRAVDIAAEIAGKFGAKLNMVVVREEAPEFAPGSPEYAMMERRIDERILDHGNLAAVPAIDLVHTRLDELRDRAVARGASDVGSDVLFGDPAEELLQYARKRKPDLLIMGTRGHGRLEGLLVGSVAQKLVSLAPCPILVVP